MPLKLEVMKDTIMGLPSVINCNKENYYLTIKKTVYKGWEIYYSNYDNSKWLGETWRNDFEIEKCVLKIKNLIEIVTRNENI